MGSTKIWRKEKSGRKNNNQELDTWSLYLYAMKSPVTREKYQKRLEKFFDSLGLEGITPTFQPSNFGRVYAAYGGIFVVMAIIWGLIMDKKRPDRYEIIGGFIVLIGASVIFYFPR